MSKRMERVELITGHERRRRFSAEEKVRLVEETTRPGMTVSAVARLHGVSPSLLFGWRRRMAEGGLEAVRADDDVVAASRVRELEAKLRELECLLGRKTMEAEILREALEHARLKKMRCACRRCHQAVSGESRGRHPGRRPLEPRRSAPAASAPPPWAVSP
jgi:transposase